MKPRHAILLELAEPATGLQQSTSDPACIVRGEEDRNGGNILRCAEAA
jgi:hypothetical protein